MFLNRGNDPRQKDFAQGVSEDLATDLSKLSRLHVISSDSLANEHRWMSMQHVAHELGVRYSLHGSVRRAGDRVCIDAKLIDATAGRLIWADRYDGTLADVFAFQDGVTKRIVAALAVTLSPGEEAGLYSCSPDETHGSVRNGLPPGKIAIERSPGGRTPLSKGPFSARNTG